MRSRVVAAGVALALGGALTLLAAAPAMAASVNVTIANLTFVADDTDVAAGAAVTVYGGAGGPVAIPGTVTIGANTYAVTSIAANVFENKALTSVTIPATVTSIGSQAFLHSGLSSVVLPAGLTSLGDGAFSLNSFTTVTVPAAITTVPFAAFDGNNLTSVTFAGAPTAFANSAFANNDFTSFTIPPTVTSLGDNEFIQNTGLTSLTIPASVTSLGHTVVDPTATKTVTFDGAVPATFTAAGPTGSFGNPAGLTVRYRWAFGAPQAAGGFTTPTWNGYSTVELDTLHFDMQGHGVAPAAQDVVSGGVPTKPADPGASGAAFTGWFTSAALTTPFDFAAPLTADATAFAGWSTAATGPRLAATGATITPGAVEGAAGATVLGAAFLLLAVIRRRRRSV